MSCDIASSGCNKTSFPRIKHKWDSNTMFVSFLSSIVSLTCSFLDIGRTQNICIDTYTCGMAPWVNLYAFGAEQVFPPAFVSLLRHWVSMSRKKYFKIKVLHFISKSIQLHRFYASVISDASCIHLSTCDSSELSLWNSSLDLDLCALCFFGTPQHVDF